MACQDKSIKSLLANDDVRKKVSCFIQKEVLPEWSDNDIEIVQENISKKPLKVKRKRNSPQKGHKSKRLNGLRTLPEPEKDSYLSVCGLKVNVKSLLENEDIRKQLAPFIEEIVISDWSDSSDIEEIEKNYSLSIPVPKNKNKLTRLKNVKKPKKNTANLVIENVVSGPQPFIEVLIPEESRPEEIAGIVPGDDTVKIPTATEINLNKNGQESLVEGHFQILVTDDSADDGNLVGNSNNIPTKRKRSILKKPENRNNSLKKRPVHKKVVDKYENENLVLVHEFDEDENINLDTNNVPDTPLLESDDWYYLNMATAAPVIPVAPEISVDQNKTLTSEQNVEPDQLIVNQEVAQKVTKTVKGKRKRRRRKPWSRQLLKNRQKVQLQGRIIKKSIKSVEMNVLNVSSETNKPPPVDENTNSMSSFESPSIGNIRDANQNGPKKSGLCSVIKEETMLLDTSVAEAAEAQPFIKQEPISDCYDQIAMELSKINKLNIEIERNEMSVKRELEVSWNTNSDYCNKYANSLRKRKLKSLKNENQKQKQCKTVVGHVTPRNVQAQQKSKLNVKRMFFGGRRVLGKCFKCGKKYERLGNLRRHELKCEFAFECALCPYVTTNKIGFKDHLVNHILGTVDENTNHDRESTNDTSENNRTEQEGPRNYLMARCSICDGDTTAVEGRTRCVKCLTTLGYYCKMCVKPFDAYESLREHVLLSLGVVLTATGSCTGCGRQGFPSACELRNHQRTKCPVMGKASGGKPKCPKLAYVRLALYKPPPVDTLKGTPYLLRACCPKCETTNIAFQRNANCAKCQSPLSYKCDMCEDLSPTYADLRAHVFKVHVIDPHQCCGCGQVFELSCLLQSHERFCRARKPVHAARCEKESLRKENNVAESLKQFDESVTQSTKPEIKLVENFKQLIEINAISVGNIGSITVDDIIYADIIIEADAIPEKNIMQPVQTDTKLAEIGMQSVQTIAIPAENVMQSAQMDAKSAESVMQSAQMDAKTAENVMQSLQTNTESAENEKKITDTDTKDLEGSTHENTKQCRLEKNRENFATQVASSSMDNNTASNKKVANTEIFNNENLSKIQMHTKSPEKKNGAVIERVFNDIGSKISKKTKCGLANRIKRYCLKCDKPKKYYEKIKMGQQKEICRKCKMQLIYQCSECNGICKSHGRMAQHVNHRCAPPLRFFSVSHKSYLRKVLERRYAILEAQQNALDSCCFEEMC